MIGTGDAPLRCSAAGCSSDALWRVNWRNPRIHSADRVKVWLACDAHRASLAGYLETRGFPVRVTERDEVVEAIAP